MMNDPQISEEFELIDPLPAWKHRGLIENPYEEIGIELFLFIINLVNSLSHT